MRKRAVQQGRSERRGESYSVAYVEPLRFTPCRIRHSTSVNAAETVRRQCPARTPLATFFRILLGIDEDRRQGEEISAVAAVKEVIRTRWPHSDPMSH